MAYAGRTQERARPPSRTVWAALTAALLAACASEAPAAQQHDASDAAVATLLDGSTPVRDASLPPAFDAGQLSDSAGDAASTPDGDAAVADASLARRPRPIARGAITGPITGSGAPSVTPPGTDLAPQGYVEEEFYLTGDAHAYKAEGEQGIDGVWGATSTGQAPFKTRLLVRRPALPERFNGTVLVEWLNVTGNIDTAVGYVFTSEELLRGGYAYVGVSVQSAGVDALKLFDAERYGALVHPGDLYAYDIFAQAGAALGWPGATNPLPGMAVERVVAYGESQSAMRMITYVNAVQPQTHVFDGVIIHSRAGWGAPVGDEGNGLLGNGKPVHVRSDSDARVLQLFTESEMYLSLGPAFAARQPDSDILRTWEMAGTAHADARLLGKGTDIGCGLANEGHQHYVTKAGLRAMHVWLKQGKAPANGPPLTVDAAQKALLRDAYGNALGGVRTPAVDVPIAMLSGEPTAANAWNPSCMLFGQTVPFTTQQLAALYPTHQDYVDKVVRSARTTRDAGFLLPEDEASVIAEATAARVPQ